MARPLRLAGAGAWLALALAGPACSMENIVPPNPPDKAAVPPARDGNIAIRQELDAARQAGTLEAYDLFIARHPQHPLAETARRERQRLAERQRR
jgi:hypothetical protein